MRLLKVSTAIFCACLAAGASCQQGNLQFTVFDAPGAGTAPGQGTLGLTNNAAGWVVGLYIDSGNTSHGFLRAPNGAITPFDPPGSTGTYGFTINASAETAGYYSDSSGIIHSFVRSPAGVITVYDVPQAYQAPGYGTFGWSMNDRGDVTGYYYDSSFVIHCFLRSADGATITVDHPQAGTGPGQGTVSNGGTGINNAGSISGQVVDANGVGHGFLRTANGEFTLFEAPGAATGPGQGTTANSLTEGNQIDGYYYDSGNAAHGLVWSPERGVVEFDAPGAGSGPGQGTFPASINPAGQVTGYFIDGTGLTHGFQRSRGGSITEFDAPGATTAPGPGPATPLFSGIRGGTVAITNNPRGTFTGYFTDANGVVHGMVVTAKSGGH